MTTNRKRVETDALIQYDNRLFLAQTLAAGQETGKITRGKVDEIHQDIAALSHKLITIKVEDRSSPTAIRAQIQEAFALTSLGMEYGSKGDVDKSVRLLNKNRPIKFFQIGNTLADKLVTRSQNTLEEVRLISPEIPTLPFIAQEEIQVYNNWEREFLESISQRKLVIDLPQIALDGVFPPQPLTSLGDITIANRQLDYLDYRLMYLQTLPQEKVFAPEYLPDASGDIPGQITRALMVNLILYREIDFHLHPEDWDNFRDIAYDADDDAIKKEARDRLVGWIGHYLDLAGQPHEVKKYAIEYWRYCLKQLEAELQKESKREAVDVLRT